MRGFSVENGGKILKMSASKRRLGTSSDARYGMGQAEYEKLKERIKKKNIPQKDYFINVDRNPLLFIYAVELGVQQPSSQGEKTNIEISSPVFGFGIGIPTLSDHETKYARYILNKIAIQQIFEGEYDAWDADEEID